MATMMGAASTIAPLGHIVHRPNSPDRTYPSVQSVHLLFPLGGFLYPRAHFERFDHIGSVAIPARARSTPFPSTYLLASILRFVAPRQADLWLHSENCGGVLLVATVNACGPASDARGEALGEAGREALTTFLFPLVSLLQRHQPNMATMSYEVTLPSQLPPSGHGKQRNSVGFVPSLAPVERYCDASAVFEQSDDTVHCLDEPLQTPGM